MSTLQLAPETSLDDRPVLSAPARGGSGVTYLGVLRSEWVKLRSVRSSTTTIAAGAGVLLLIGLISAAIMGGLVTGIGDGPDAVADPAGATLQGVLLAQLVLGVLGVLVITSEYATGLIRTTFTAVPRRLPVLWAKAAVVAAVTFPTMLAAALVTFFVGQVFIGNGGGATAALGDPGVLRAIVGTAGYLSGIALLGLAVGTLLRSTAAGISTLFGVVFLLPGLGALLLPASWGENVLQFLPSNAGSAFTSVVPTPDLLSPGAGLAVFAAWVAVPLALAAVALKRRNV